MCMGLAKKEYIKRADPSIKNVDGNVFDPKESPPEIDNTPVIQKKKVKNNVTNQTSDLNINTNTTTY